MLTGTRPFGRRLLVLAAFSLALGACATDETSPASPAAAPSSSHAAALGGRVIARDDAGLGDSPATGSLVVLTPASAAEMWSAGEGGTPPPRDLRYAQRTLPVGVVERLASAVAPLRDGRFALDVPDGPYVVCLADGRSLTSVRGCAEVDVGEEEEVEFTTGEAGFARSPSVVPSD